MPVPQPFASNSRLAARQSSLAAFHTAAQAVVDVLLATHPELNSPAYRARTDHRGVAARTVLRRVEKLLAALERYKGLRMGKQIPKPYVAPCLLQIGLSVPSWWLTHEAIAVHAFLESAAEAVWMAHEEAIGDVDLLQAREPSMHEADAVEDDIPF